MNICYNTCYVSDLGLLCAKKDLAANDILYMVEEINDFKGGMAENYVNVQLSINGYHTYKPAYAIKLSAQNFGFEDNKKIVSLSNGTVTYVSRRHVSKIKQLLGL